MVTKKEAKVPEKKAVAAAAGEGSKAAKPKPAPKAAAAEAAPAPVVPSQAQAAKLTIDGVEYALAALSEEARQQVVNVRGVDQEIERLRLRLAIAQTARGTYMAALKQALPQP